MAKKRAYENGSVVWTGAYYPFGEMITGTGDVHGFTGKELDVETGLNYFCQRYYDSQIGRFITLDPVDDKKGTSPYAYCSNDPLKVTDPTGETSMAAEWVKWQMEDDAFFFGTMGGNGFIPYTGWAPRNWFLGSSAELDPDFWAKGWDYHSNNPEFMQYIRWLSTGFGDIEIILPGIGWCILNIGQFIQANNIQIMYSVVPEGQSPHITYGWCDAWEYEGRTGVKSIIGMQNKKIYLNIDMEDDWDAGTRWEIHVAAIAHETIHHWLAGFGGFSRDYHERIAYFVTNYFSPGSWPFVCTYRP